MPNAQSAPGWLVPQQRINLSPVPQQTGAVCAWAGCSARCEHGTPAFFRHQCRVSPSPTPVTLPPFNGTTSRESALPADSCSDTHLCLGFG
jgi:hypothetical protein